MHKEEMKSLDYREKVLEKMKSTEFDILVIGGGITGAGIARDAALRGYSVALIEKNDFGYGTSSGSSKIVHAGIRYLAQREYRLVREGSKERRRILDMAPHLSRPIQFILPAYSDMIFKKSRIRIGVWLYDILANFRNFTFHKIINAKDARSLLPSPLREENFEGAVIYGDGLMDDARLTLEIILSAEEHGASVLNYCELIGIEDLKRTVNAVRVLDHIENVEFDIKTRVIALACGHWTDRVANMFDPSIPKRIRPTKGIHIITRKIYDKDYVLGLPIKDRRVFFVVPFGEYNLIGTTDTDYTDDSDYVPVNAEDVEYLINAINFLFPGALHKEDVISAYSGVRPLVISPNAKSESDVSRNHEIFVVKPNVYAIAGGKFITYRVMAKDIVDRLSNLLGKKGKCITEKVPLFGWPLIKRKHWDNWVTIALENLTIRYQLPKDIALHLLRYGKNYIHVCELIDSNPLLSERISEDRPYVLAEINYYLKYEKAVSLNDVMLRRTQLQLSSKQGLDCVERVAKHMAKILGWSSDKIYKEVAAYKNVLVWKS
ncbi:MAG: glycerol-3-phosphate dehydrogenase/oxidase [Promethearchaeota archaeon]